MEYSVVIPAWNREDFVARAVKSVADQDCVDRSQIEIIVVDDGSTDGTVRAAKGADVGPARLVVMEVTHSGEPGTTRNHALEAATGEFVAYCDSDDYWLPHHLATARAAFDADPGLGMVSNFWGLASFSVSRGEIRTDIIVPHHVSTIVNTNCRVHRRSCLDVGRFNTSRWGEDQDFFSRIEARYRTHKTRVVSSVNGYIRKGNNLTYQSDQGVKGRFF